MGMCREGLVLFALCRTIGVIGLITLRNYPELIEINRLISTTFVVACCSTRCWFQLPRNILYTIWESSSSYLPIFLESISRAIRSRDDEISDRFFFINKIFQTVSTKHWLITMVLDTIFAQNQGRRSILFHK